MVIFGSKIEFSVNFVRHHHPPGSSVSVQAIGHVVTKRTRNIRIESNRCSVNRNDNDREVNILFLDFYSKDCAPVVPERRMHGGWAIVGVL